MSVDNSLKSRQATVRESVCFMGIGLHSGEHCGAVVRPAPAHNGIIFRISPEMGANEASLLAAPLTAAPSIEANPYNVVRYDHGTTLANGCGDSVSTVEHLLAAMALAGIDNAFVDVYGPEIPILDGSAAPFLDGLRRTGFRSHAASRTIFKVQDEITVTSGNRRITIEPAEKFSLNVVIDFENCVIGRQEVSVTLRGQEEVNRIASSRTFCRLHEVDALRRAGLIRGGSLENSIVVDGDRILNGGVLRDIHEFALHKALDLIGDLYLIGAPIIGAITAVRPGHDLNCSAAASVYRKWREADMPAMAQA